MKLFLLVEQEDDPVPLLYPHELKNNYEIASYISGLASDYVDEEMMQEYFFHQKAVLKKVPINSLKEGNPDANIRSVRKEKKYAKMSTPIPPLVVVEGEIVDGNHRYRVAKAKGLNDIWIYDVVREDEDEDEIISEERNASDPMNANIGDVLTVSDIFKYVESLHYNIDDFYEGDLGERIEQYSYYKLRLIPIEKIDIVYQTDDDRLEDYEKLFNQSNDYPPIVLESEYMGSYDIIDGTHRATVLTKLGIKEIKAWVGIN